MDIKETFICVNTFTSKKNGKSYFKLYTFDDDQGVVNENFIDEKMYDKLIDSDLCFGDLFIVVDKPNNYMKLEPKDFKLLD